MGNESQFIRQRTAFVKKGGFTMKKKILSLLIVLALCLSLLPSVYATDGLNNFQKIKEYFSDQFTDVNEADWYYPNIKSAYELGLVQGDSRNSFNPYGNITIAETITFATRIHNIYHGSKCSFVQGTPWYQVYLDYAIENGIIAAADYTDYNATATRAQCAVILAKALPQEALPAINSILFLPDVDTSTNEGKAILNLYNAGILTGNDQYGTFAPKNSIQRCEVAAIVTRLADSSLRKTITLVPTIDHYVYCPIQEQYSVETWFGQTYDMECNIPQFKFDTPDAQAYNQEIMNIGLEARESQQQFQSPVYADEYVSVVYDAWLSNDVVVIDLTVLVYEGYYRYLYILDASTGWRMTNGEIATRLEIYGNISDHIQNTMRQYIESKALNDYYPDMEHTETQLKLTLAADNLRKSVVYPDKNGTPMLWCYIFEDFYSNSFDLVILPLI